MPRRPIRREWEDLSANYRKRLMRYGIGPSYYQSGGTLQLARGHRPREFARRRERNPLALLSNDYRFLRAQAKRNGLDPYDGDNHLTKFYRTLSVSQREVLRARVAVEHRRWKARGQTKIRTLQEYVNELRNDYPWFTDDVVGLAFYH